MYGDMSAYSLCVSVCLSVSLINFNRFYSLINLWECPPPSLSECSIHYIFLGYRLDIIYLRRCW